MNTSLFHPLRGVERSEAERSTNPKLIVVGTIETSVDKLVLLLGFIFILLLNLNIL